MHSVIVSAIKWPLDELCGSVCQLLCRHLVTRKDCCKGCEGRVLRSIQVCHPICSALILAAGSLQFVHAFVAWLLPLAPLTQCSRHQHLPACLLSSWLLVAALWTAGQGVPKWRHPACTCISRRRSGQLCRCRPCVIKEGAACLAELLFACFHCGYPHPAVQMIVLQAHPHLALPSLETPN